MDLKLAEQVGMLLKERHETLTTAESCTGGGLAYAITSIPGSSQWFDRAYVTYSNQAKIEMLGISESLLAQFGAVSKEAALSMAEKALTLSQSAWSIAITGIAGPDGGTVDTPVGTVWIAWASQQGYRKVTAFHFTGERMNIRSESVNYSLIHLYSVLSNPTDR